MSLNARQIEVIHAVVRTGSVTDAASILGVSQPAVSMTLRECNQLVGFPLFERRQGRMQPTHETLILVPELEKIVSGMHRIDQLVDDLRESSVGYVRLAVAPLLADSIVPLALASFKREHVQLSLNSAYSDHIAGEVESDRADLGLTISATRSDSDLVLDFGGTELICMLHKHHVLATRQSLHAIDIAPFPLITFSRVAPLGALTDDIFRDADLNYNVVCEVSNASTACALVEQNIGVALIPAIGFSPERYRDLVAIPFCPSALIYVQLMMPKHRRISRAARRLITTLRTAARQVLTPLPSRLVTEADLITVPGE